VKPNQISAKLLSRGAEGVRGETTDGDGREEKTKPQGAIKAIEETKRRQRSGNAQLPVGLVAGTKLEGAVEHRRVNPNAEARRIVRVEYETANTSS
jgi:hypothetical protein